MGRALVHAGILAVLLLIPGCREKTKEAAAPLAWRAPLVSTGSARAEGLSDVEMKLRFARKVRVLLAQAQYQDLERLAEALRKAPYCGYYDSESLYLFYQVLAARDERYVRKVPREVVLAQTRRWVEASPRSVAARIARAWALADYAWEARGGGPARNVKWNGWRLFHLRLKDAKKVLEEAETMEGRDPCLYEPYMEVALGEGWSREEYDELLRRATAITPAYPGVYDLKTRYLMPEWYGESGDLAAFAEEAVEETRTTEGMSLYAHIAYATYHYKGDGIFREMGFTWEHMREGFRDILKRHPKCRAAARWYAETACNVRDRRAAREAFLALTPDPAPYAIWGDVEKYHRERSWALRAR